MAGFIEGDREAFKAGIQFFSVLGRTHSQHFRNTEHASHSTARMAGEYSNPFIWEHSKAIKHYAHTILFLTLLSFPCSLTFLRSLHTFQLDLALEKTNVFS